MKLHVQAIQPRPLRQERLLLWVVVMPLLMVSAAALASAYLSQHGTASYPLVLTEHFVMHYGAAQLVAVLLAGWPGSWRTYLRRPVVMIIFGGLALNVVNVTTARMQLAEAVATMPTTRPVTMLVSNVERRNQDTAKLCAQIAAEAPDLVALVEPDQRWLDAISRCTPGLALVGVGRYDNFGIALLSRWPVRCDGDSPSQTGVRRCVRFLGSEFPTLVATVEVPTVRAAASGAPAAATVPITVVVTHPIPPMSREFAGMNLRQLEAIATLARGHTGPMVITGDFNATPWSGAFRRLAARGMLHDSRPWYAYQATWPAALSLVGIPIDQVVANRYVWFTSRRVLANIGSDHRPVLVTFVAQD